MPISQTLYPFIAGARSSSTLLADQTPGKARNPLTGAILDVCPALKTTSSISDARATNYLLLVDREDAAYIYLIDSENGSNAPRYIIPRGFKHHNTRTLAIGKIMDTHKDGALVKGARCVYTVTKSPPAITPHSIAIEHRDPDAKPYAFDSLLVKRALHKGLNLTFATQNAKQKWKIDALGMRNGSGSLVAKEVSSSRQPGFEGACELQLASTIDEDEMDFLVSVWVARIGNEVGSLEGHVDVRGLNEWVQGELMYLNYSHYS